MVEILPLCERLQAKPGLNEETENSINAAWLKKISSGKLFRLETPSTHKANTSTLSLPSRRLSATKVIKSSGVMSKVWMPMMIRVVLIPIKICLVSRAILLGIQVAMAAISPRRQTARCLSFTPRVMSPGIIVPTIGRHFAMMFSCWHAMVLLPTTRLILPDLLVPSM